MSLITLPGDAGHILRNQRESRLRCERCWRPDMANKKRDLLEVLRLELEFLENGGYRKVYSWRPQFIFEDSPTCLNYGNPAARRPCSECVLMQLVPSPDFARQHQLHQDALGTRSPRPLDFHNSSVWENPRK